MPALLNTTCTSPNTRNASSARWPTSSSLRTSHTTPCASTPSARSVATASSRADRSMSLSITRAPRRANSLAAAKPIPFAPPVMTVARPWKLSTARTLRLVGRRLTQLPTDRVPRIGVLTRLLPVRATPLEERPNERSEKGQDVPRPSRVCAHLGEHVGPRMMLELQRFLRARGVHPLRDEPVVVAVGITRPPLGQAALDSARFGQRRPHV